MIRSVFSLPHTHVARFGPKPKDIALARIDALPDLELLPDSGAYVLQKTEAGYGLFAEAEDGSADPARPVAEDLHAPVFCAPGCIVFGLNGGSRIVLALNGFPNTVLAPQAQQPALTGFLGNTRVLGRSGIVTVDSLTAGDLLWTMHHGMQPIRWIARTQVEFDPDNPTNHPVRIAPDSFGRGCPTDPLDLLPDHPVFTRDMDLDPGLAPPDSFLNAAQLLETDHAHRPEIPSKVDLIHLGLDVSDVVYASGLMVQNPQNDAHRPTRSQNGHIEAFVTHFPELSGLLRFSTSGPKAMETAKTARSA